MLVDLSVIPVGGDPHSSNLLARALEIVDQSGLPYQLTPSGTCIEGEWDEVMALVRKCHEAARETRSHVVTLIKIEDDAGEHGKLSRNVASVEGKLGRSLGRPDDASEASNETPALLR
jgi:uncharacterized protein (TIGR00106 family)